MTWEMILLKKRMERKANKGREEEEMMKMQTQIYFRSHPGAGKIVVYTLMPIATVLFA